MLEAIRVRSLRFVFLAPEQLANEETLAALCAAPTVRAEIVQRLRLDDPLLVVRGFDRPNIWLGVECFFDDLAKLDALLDRTTAAAKPGIVYAATRKGAEGLAQALVDRGVRADAYHAGLAKHRREEVQDAFMPDDLEVVVATIAFGMGIDKPNVRFVFHADSSDSVDAYYQEIGRSERDGERADAILFYRAEDLGLRRFFGGSAHLELQDVVAVMAAVQRTRKPRTREQLAKIAGVPAGKTGAVLDRLEQLGAVEISLAGEVTAAR